MNKINAPFPNWFLVAMVVAGTGLILTAIAAYIWVDPTPPTWLLLAMATGGSILATITGCQFYFKRYQLFCWRLQEAGLQVTRGHMNEPRRSLGWSSISADIARHQKLPLLAVCTEEQRKTLFPDLHIGTRWH